MVLAKLEQIDRKLELHFKPNEHREETERAGASLEKTFDNFLWTIQRLEGSVTKDVDLNMALLQNQSSLIQTACANHEQFREKWFNFTSQDNEGPQDDKGFSSLNESTTTTTPAPKFPAYSSCKNASCNVTGVYLISVNNASAPFQVYCEQEKLGGGWIVVQHRFDGSVDFYRNWTQYRDGFGELDKEFWLSLERIHQITTARAHELIIEMKDFEGNYGYARYSAYEVGSESEEYELKNLGSYRGTAGDSLAYHKWMKF
ncbi:angiopoietin-related protein 1-like [Anopheles aquasalis]|uniref:angiopoietin-related protein 1-like n=1 Tax=Anopheles aquasalis TaxID=42839 RepID=UPI00215AB951|nr:angiopoietin-related protein 1-like [Anopheles aquasalis]